MDAPQRMLILADENISIHITKALVEDGLTIERATLSMPGAVDEAVLARSFALGAVLLTEDRDFGNLVILRKLPAHGVVLIAMGLLSPQAEAARVRSVFADRRNTILGHFTVVEPTRIRARILRPLG